MKINIKQFFADKRPGFYVGVAGALLALIALFIYIGMNSAYFTGWVVAGLILGIVAFVLSAIFRLRILHVLSYACYMFAFYHFFVQEVELRMDTIVDPMQGFWKLDGVFYVGCIFFIACIIVTIVASCLSQNKAEE